MKIFDFKCPTCGNITEKLVKSKEDFVECMECGSAMKPMVSAPAVQFKGDGWCKPRDKGVNRDPNKVLKDIEKTEKDMGLPKYQPDVPKAKVRPK